MRTQTSNRFCSRFRAPVACGFTAMICAVLAGCGGSAPRVGPELTASVKGTVSLNGTPVQKARITFENSDIGVYGAVINDDGTYTVPAMAEGEFKVTVTPTETSNPMVAPADGSMPETAKPTGIPANYSSIENTQEKVTIDAGENTYDLNMTS